MITGPKRCILVALESGAADSFGNRQKRVARAKVLVAKVDFVGVQTANVAAVQGFRLSYSVEISRIQYESEKFLLFDQKLYEVKSIGKASAPNNLLLNVQEVSDSAIQKAIKEWQNANL